MTLLAVCLAVLMVPVSLSGTSVALPAIGEDLHANVVPLQWVVNAYNVVAASFMLASGSLADLFGRRRLFALGTALFGLCGLICALATDIVLLDVARGVAGLGSAAIITAGSAILATSFEGPARNRAFALIGVTIGAGLALGPTSSGLLIGAFGWRAVFLTQLVVAVAVLVAVPSIAESKDRHASRVDWAGTATFTSGLFLLTLAVVEGPQFGWASPTVLGLFAGFGLLMIAFVVVERRQSRPMFDLVLFRQPRFVALCLLPVAFSFGFVGLVVLLPSYFIGANGSSSQTAGMQMLLLTVPVLVVPLLGGRLLRVGMSTRTLLTLSLAITTVGVVWLTVLRPGIGWAELAGPLLVIGFGQGLSTGLMDGAAITSVEQARAGMAAGMFNTMRLAGEAVAIATMGAVLVSLVQAQLSAGIGRFAGQTGDDVGTLADSVVSGNLAGPAAELPAGSRGAFVDFLANGYTGGLHTILWAVAVICAVSTVVVYFMLAERDSGPKTAPASEETIAETVS